MRSINTRMGAFCIFIIAVIGIGQSPRAYGQANDSTEYIYEEAQAQNGTSGNSIEDFHEHDVWIGAGYATGIDRSKKTLGIQQGIISVGGLADNFETVHFFLSYLHSPMLKTSSPEYDLEDGLSIVEFGAEAKFYTQSKYAFLGHYFSFGAGGVFAYWNYSMNERSEWEITEPYDHTWGLNIYCGTGFEIGRIEPVNVNIDINPGVIFWATDTYQGFSQGILPIYFYIKAKVSISFAIGHW